MVLAAPSTGLSLMETPLIGSGSQEEVDNRVRAILDMGTSRGYLTYEELNEKLPDEVVSPDKLDSLLMMIDEMGIRLLDETDIADFIAKPRGGKATAFDGVADRERFRQSCAVERRTRDHRRRGRGD